MKRICTSRVLAGCSDGVIWATVLNRAQNQLDLYFVDAASGKSRRVLSEKSDTWIETDDNFQVLKSGDKFIWPSWRDGHTHLYLYSFDKANPLAADAKLVNQITKGDFEVFDVEGVDDATGTVFRHYQRRRRSPAASLQRQARWQRLSDPDQRWDAPGHGRAEWKVFR